MAGRARFAVAVALAAVACAGLVGVGLVSQGHALAGDAKSRSSHDPALTDRIIEIGTTDNRAMEHLEHLCNQIGARPAGTRSNQEACEWARDKLTQFGLANVHLEECGEIASGFFVSGHSSAVTRFLRWVTFRDPDGKPVKLYNVVADIPGTERPDEYVIVGAHIDSTPRGTGAADNATGVAAVMEAARLLMEAGAMPSRTIRFILFAGEEVGLVGSRGYLEAHAELVPKIAAMYNMDQGSDYISKVSATEPLLADMEAIFAPAKELNPSMPFAVQLVDYLPRADPNCCRSAVASQACGDGPVWAVKKAFKRNPDGSLEEVDADLKALGITEEDLKRGVDSQGRKLVTIGGCGGGEDAAGNQASGQPCGLTDKDLAGMGVNLADTTAGPRIRIRTMGSSDHAPFLAAGIPAFYWGQGDSGAVMGPLHTDADTFDKVVPRNVEHSATVIALGALGTANLDHMLSRERLAAPAGEAADAAAPVPRWAP